MTVIAGLPTGQNVFVLAVRFQEGLVLTRDAVFMTTLASVPTILCIAWLLS